jgi:hypothetical protein
VTFSMFTRHRRIFTASSPSLWGKICHPKVTTLQGCGLWRQLFGRWLPVRHWICLDSAGEEPWEMMIYAAEMGSTKQKWWLMKT